MKKGMTYIIPPLSDPTVPLLGPYQMAGYAKSVQYPFFVYDFNISFFKEVINKSYSLSFSNIHSLDDMENECCKAFIASFKNNSNYDSLFCKLKNCKTTKDYWQIIDYVRACYDLYSLTFDNARFRIDGFYSSYRNNIWQDIENGVEILQGTELEHFLETQIEAIAENQDFFGINITFESQLFIAILICKIITKKRPNAIICVGGGFVNSFINSGDSAGPLEKYCDVVCNGEGEARIYFFNNIEYSSTYTDIRAMLLERGQNTFKRAIYVEAKNLCTSMLPVSSPYFLKENLSSYFSPKKIIPLRFTYQCYWGRCKFCTDKENHSCFSKKYDYKSMIDFCILSAQQNLIDGIYFLDSAISYKVLKFFASALIEQNIKLQWGTNARFDSVFVDEDFIALLSKSGCTFIKFGLESASQKVLNLMDKGTKIENAAKIINLCRKYGILVHTYIMFAFPGEDESDREETARFLLNDFSHPDNYNCSEFIMYGTSIIAKELNYNLKAEFTEEGWHSSSYAFTNDKIKDFIKRLRYNFDNKYSPANMLISTGHTIAYGKRLQVSSQKIKLKGDSILSKTSYAIFSVIKGLSYCGV